jgi:asparagine synthase (glutamine-hydrolysing)
MFVALAGDPRALDSMAAHLSGSPRSWRCDEGGVAVIPPFLLPEDDFDAQPIVDNDRVFTGQLRIDNRDELIAALGISEPVADSTIACLAWDRWGEASLARVAGDFAFVVWHPRERRLIAAVDHHLERRALWARVPNGLAIAAGFAPLLAHPHVSGTPDLDALARYLETQLDREITPYANIRAIPGGHLLEWRDGDVRIRRWWTPNTQASARGDFVEEARAVFDLAVRARLRARGTIASTLSGGLDSGLVTATAARQLGDRRIETYTAVPTPGLARCEERGWDSDDTPYASEVAATLANVDHRFVSAEGRCMLDLFEPFETPTRHILNFVWLAPLLASLRGGVLLVGEHGNATLSWDGGVPSWLRRVAVTMKRRFAARQNVISFVRRERRPRGPALGVSSRKSWIDFVMRPKSIWSPDTVERWGVEWRDPTADRRLAECVLRFPPHAFRIEGQPRGLARAIAAGRLPERVRLRRTRGSQVPEVASLIAIHARRYESALERMTRSAACRELFDFGEMRRALDTIVGGSLEESAANSINRAFDAGLFLCRSEGVS